MNVKVMNQQTIEQNADFAKTLVSEAADYGLTLPDETVNKLVDYYGLINLWNPRLHLVAPCAPAEFARRHILESVYAIAHLPPHALLIDVGAGAGLPSVPCLVARPDLRGELIEASIKKSIFLREALQKLNRARAAIVVNNRFESLTAPKAEALTCRALDKFSALLPRLLKWSARVSRLLLFGGPALAARLDESTPYESYLLPNSRQRYLFVIQNMRADESANH
ncbi:MAG: RsmG family class I SAM-dependent methyltransferase [Pyrinomonadaceae bacterium]